MHTFRTMTTNEYFDNHIPHRLNLLIAFRTRYSDRHGSTRSLDPELYRDLFRCAKDICFVMTRFFCHELGVTLDRKTQQLKDYGDWTSTHGTERVQLSAITSDHRCSTLILMLKAANGAVAHMDDRRVDHHFKTHQEEQEMISIIDWIEQLVSQHLYKIAGRNLASSMALPNNVMVR